MFNAPTVQICELIFFALFSSVKNFCYLIAGAYVGTPCSAVLVSIMIQCGDSSLINDNLT